MATNVQMQALGDATRRSIVERLAGGPMPVGELARDLPVSRPAVSQHLKVLKDAGLVTDRRQGTRRLYQLDPEGLAVLRAYLDELWRQALAVFQVSARANPTPRRSISMSARPAVAPVSASVLVEAPIEHAFAVFTTRLDAWWPREHKIGAAAMKEAVLEPREGGRWFERDEDGTECDWGRVLAYDPPHRILLAWQLDGRWQYDPELVTEVEVRFSAEGDARTRVDLEHHNLDRLGDHAEGARASFAGPGGWSGLLARYAATLRG